MPYNTRHPDPPASHASLKKKNTNSTAQRALRAEPPGRPLPGKSPAPSPLLRQRSTSARGGGEPCPTLCFPPPNVHQIQMYRKHGERATPPPKKSIAQLPTAVPPGKTNFFLS
ncbi:unnamed protein product, partial [Ectocarpus fasciculatus]